LVKLGFRAGDERDLRTVAIQASGDHLAYALAGASDQGNFPGQIRAHEFSPVEITQ
jgi:hypothetical protein